MNILEKITAYKREFVAEARRKVPLDEMRQRAESARPTRPFAAVLRGTRGLDGQREAQADLRIVAEVKKASPSKGIIRADFDPVEIARSYERGGANALSVLTDEEFFQGSLDYVIQIRAAVSLPILRKEFIIDPYQVYEARGAGADCILLIAGLIDWKELRDLRELAKALQLDVLLEIHGEDELEPGFELEPDVFGINNRNLRSADLHTDLSRTIGLIDRIPHGQTVISESGIRDTTDTQTLARLGIDAVLVGEHLMREPDPGAAIASRLGIGKANFNSGRQPIQGHA